MPDAFRNLMLNCNTLDFLTEEQKGDKFYQTVQDLHEDLVFFKMYVERNKKSKFNFEIVPSDNVCRRFLRDLFLESYSGHTDIEYVKKMLIDYYIVKNFFDTLSGEEIKYDDDQLKNIKSYFNSYHNMQLINYVGDFIGCSHTCGIVEKRYEEI